MSRPGAGLAAPAGVAWSTMRDAVETVELRPGLTLVLSQLASGGSRTYAHEESDAVFGIGFHLDGGAHFRTRTRTFATTAGDVWALHAERGECSSFTLPAGGFRAASLRMDPDLAGDLVAELKGPARTVALRPLDADGRQAVVQMFAAPYVGRARTLFLESRAMALLAAQLDRLDAAGDRSPMGDLRARRCVARAVTHLDAHLLEPPSIATLARHCGTNEFTLKACFKQITGDTIFGYVRRQRMARAMRELDAGMSVAQAAHTVGYCCPRSFAQAFRREFGVLPGSCARRHGIDSRTPR